MMAYYNNYYPATYYNPYQQAPTYQPVMQAPVMQQQPQQQTTQPVQTTSILWVENEREAALYPVAPNNAVTLWSRSEPVVYWKQADASGKVTMKTYDLVERHEQGKDENADTPAYATKDELAAVLEAVRGVTGGLSTLRSELDGMKEDVYGLAGRKKSGKKETADDA